MEHEIEAFAREVAKDSVAGSGKYTVDSVVAFAIELAQRTVNEESAYLRHMLIFVKLEEINISFKDAFKKCLEEEQKRCATKAVIKEDIKRTFLYAKKINGPLYPP